jgi:mRNA interferase RelE/StbE
LFRVRIHRRATRALDDLPASVRDRVLDLLQVLEVDPFRVRGFDVERLRGMRGWLRVRVGDYRVVYWVDERDHVVSVERIAPRGGAYGG